MNERDPYVQSEKVGRTLESIEPGDRVRIVCGRRHREDIELELIADDVPSNPKSNVTTFWESDADTSRSAKDLLDEGYRHINVQSARRHSYATEAGYKYEVRDLMNDDIDGCAVKKLTRV